MHLILFNRYEQKQTSKIKNDTCTRNHAIFISHRPYLRYEQELEISLQEARVERLKLEAQAERRRVQQEASRDANGEDANAHGSDDDDDINLDSVEALPQK